MSWELGKGRFTKQYYINFPDGVEFYGWVFLNDNGKVSSGYRFKYPDGGKNFYTLAEELDKSNLSRLERGLLSAVKQVAKEAGAKVQELKLSAKSADEQVDEMINKNIAGKVEDWEMTLRGEPKLN